MSIVNSLLNVLLVLSSAFLILLVLIQRGKGGGLAGAFGGVGGSSAFGTKAGDVFTRVTIYTALVWFILNMLLVFRMNQRRDSVFGPTDVRSRSAASKVPGQPEPAVRGSASKGTEPAIPAPAPEPLPTLPASDTKTRPEPKDELPPVFGPEDTPAPAPKSSKAP